MVGYAYAMTEVLTAKQVQGILLSKVSDLKWTLNWEGSMTTDFDVDDIDGWVAYTVTATSTGNIVLERLYAGDNDGPVYVCVEADPEMSLFHAAKATNYKNANEWRDEKLTDTVIIEGLRSL